MGTFKSACVITMGLLWISQLIFAFSASSQLFKPMLQLSKRT